MKKNLKKGFTLVELVIVIAVIAILSAVLIPTFGNVINNAKRSSAQSEASNAMTQYTVNYASQGVTVPDGYVVVLEKKVTFAEFVNAGDAVPAEFVPGTTNNSKISYVFEYTVDGGLSEKENKFSDISSSLAASKLTFTKNATTGTAGTVNLNTADGTLSTYNVYLLDGTLSEVKTDNTVTGYKLEGKVILFAKSVS